MEIKKIAVIGAGVMGRSIAEMLATKGLEVLLYDKLPEKLDKALFFIEENLDNQIERWSVTAQEKKGILSKIEIIPSLDLFGECDFAIETVTEQMDIKKQVFSNLEKVLKPGVILASNTATLSLTELASSIRNPERVIGLHFLFPVGKVDLVEIVRGLRTTDITFIQTKNFVENVLEKHAVQVYETPGFITTRLICVLINEAVHALAEGVATEADIDMAMKLGYNFQYGPLEMADRFGLDSVLASMETLFRDCGDIKYRPNYLIKKLVRAEHLGVKTDKGFFNYNKGGTRL
jgi:3-hydroxybutyryl-CoA dehydrogenase